MSSRSRKKQRQRAAQNPQPPNSPGIGRRSVVVASWVAIVAASVLIALSVVSVSGESSETTALAASTTTDGGSSTTTQTSAVTQTTEANGLAKGKSLGVADAPVTIVEFAEAQCGVCQRFATTTEKQLIETYVETGKVRLVFKEFVIYDEESMAAALATEAAAEQNKFWEYRELLMALGASSKVEGDLSIPVLQGLAEQIGLDMEAFNDALLSAKYQANVDRDFEEGLELELRGTPTFFVNGEKVEGLVPFEDFQERIDAILAETAGTSD